MSRKDKALKKAKELEEEDIPSEDDLEDEDEEFLKQAKKARNYMEDLEGGDDY